jgi:LPXTG-motif cell wall-anchored protein
VVGGVTGEEDPEGKTMRRWLFVLGCVVMGAAALVLAPSAGAQTGSLTFDPPTVVAGGGKLFINGSCEPNSDGFVISHAFARQPEVSEFAGVPAIPISTGSDGTFGIGLTIDPVVKPGAYDVTLRCGGGLAASGTLTVSSSVALPKTGAAVEELAMAGLVVLAIGLAVTLFGRRRAHA